jgi:hypothetical protein
MRRVTPGLGPVMALPPSPLVVVNAAACRMPLINDDLPALGIPARSPAAPLRGQHAVPEPATSLPAQWDPAECRIPLTALASTQKHIVDGLRAQFTTNHLLFHRFQSSGSDYVPDAYADRAHAISHNSCAGLGNRSHLQPTIAEYRLCCTPAEVSSSPPREAVAQMLD